MEKPPLGVQPFKKRKPSRPSSRKRSLNHAFIVKRADTDLAVAAKLLLWRSERKYVLIEKQLCFNCAGTKHKAFECRSQVGCLFCKRRHHSSICDRGSTEHMLVATGDTTVTYPVVVVNVEGIKCRALLDTGAGSSYASSALLERL